ncbi:MAG TPA: NAD-dependent succinate-semialdehyde dehydrogenase [Longimicrobiales bacterium]|nr:NAD-dependent succinate-semialdehyde dehydrogenase [Longimicrobiales bacterium]
MFESVSPVTGERIASYPTLSGEEVARAIERAHDAFTRWRALPVEARVEPLRRVASLLRERREEYAALITLEMGKVIGEALAEIDKCALTCGYIADHAAEFLAPEPVETEASSSFVAYEPLGPLLAIMPWNFPFWQVIRFAAPALAAGNVVLLKHAPNVPGCAVALQGVFADAGFPDGVYSNLMIHVDAVPAIIEHPLIRGVTLTGSTRAGRAVAAHAGAHLKKCVLELGGSDPYVILEDAELDTAVATCASSRLINAGQSCIAAKRFVVVDAVRPEFEARLVERMAAAVVGDPMDERTDIGPLARLDLRDTLHRQVEESIARGARCLLGGTVTDGAGAFYPPTVLTNVGPGMPAYHEELFGPVAAIIPVADEAEAIRVANDTSYGLGAAIFTRDLVRGEALATRAIDAGSVFVNTHVRSDPRLPFGGIKDSGYGRELSSHGMREFTNVKTVYVA